MIAHHTIAQRLAVALTIWFLATVVASAQTPEQLPISDGPRSNGGAVVWEVVFEEPLSVEEYARQLDFFKVELAARSRNGRVEYVSKLTAAKPEKRIEQQPRDERFHIEWTKGDLHVADRKLLSKAGVSSDGKEILHYFPEPLRGVLSKLEADYRRHDLNTITRTRYLVREKSTKDGYELVVVEQDVLGKPVQ